MHPQHIERRCFPAPTQPAEDAVVQRAHRPWVGIVPKHRQKFMTVPIQQRHVPLHAHAESLVLVAAD